MITNFNLSFQRLNWICNCKTLNLVDIRKVTAEKPIYSIIWYIFSKVYKQFLKTIPSRTGVFQVTFSNVFVFFYFLIYYFICDMYIIVDVICIIYKVLFNSMLTFIKLILFYKCILTNMYNLNFADYIYHILIKGN